MPLIFDNDWQEPDGFMPTWAFEKWVDTKLTKVASEMGVPSTSFEKVCASKYRKTRAYEDPEAYRQKVYCTFLSDYPEIYMKGAGCDCQNEAPAMPTEG